MKTASEIHCVPRGYKETIPETISFSFDDFQILGVFGDLVFLRGMQYIELDNLPIDDALKPCVVVLTQKLLSKALKNWIDAKRDYCERYHEFCGAMGQCCAYEFNEVFDNEFSLPNCNNDGNWKDVPVRTYTIHSLIDECDMEHG